VELRGSLKNFPLPDIIQLIGMGRRTGVLMVHLDRDEQASIYFESGEMTHAQYGNMTGADVIYQLFRKQQGNFQFASGTAAPSRSITADWMSIVMEAARRFDEENREGGTAGEGTPPEGDVPAVDPAEIKRRMTQVLEKHFGKKVKKIQDELEKVEADEEKLLEFCGKVEKYIFVFIDNKKAKDVAEELRNIVRVYRFS
jgi:hypothetical protein